MKNSGILLQAKKFMGVFVVVVILILVVWYGAQYLGGGVSYEAFLGVVGEGFAAILAIFFALIILPIQHASERYTVEMLKEFKKDLYTKIFFFLISYIVLFSLFLLGFYKDNSLIFTSVIFLSACLGLFALYYFYFHIIDLLDPRVLIRKKSQMISKAIKKIGTSNPSSHSTESIVAELDIPEQVLLKSIERNETDVIRDTIFELIHLCYLVSGRKEHVLGRQIFSRVLGLFTRALLYALKYDNNSKYLLVSFVRDITSLRPDKTGFNKEYLGMLMGYLYRANKLIIKYDDIELFKEQLDYFSTRVYKDKDVETELYDVFFMLGAHVLRLEGKERFVKSIWTNIDKGDTSIKIVGSKNLVNFDIKFLCEQQFRLSEIRGSKYIADIFEGYRPYMVKYFVLCLTYALHTLNYTWEITIPENDEEKKRLYIFLDYLKSQAAEYKRKCNELKAEADKWSDVIQPKTISPAANVAEETMPSVEPESETITTERAFEKTAKRIDEMEEEWGNKMKILLRALPLDSKMVDRCKEGIIQSYMKNRMVPEVLNVRTYEKEKDESLKFRWIGLRYLIDRSWFTSPTMMPEFSDMGRSIAFGEENYLIKQMIEFGETKQVERIDFEALRLAISEFKKEGYHPTSIFIPIEFFVQLHDWSGSYKSTGFRAVDYTKGQAYFVIDSETKLRIFWSSKYVKVEDFIVIDRKFGEWVVKPDESGDLLTVKIEESKEKKDKVEVLAQTAFNFRVIDPRAVRVLKRKR